MAPHVKPKDVCATRSWPGLRESGPAGVAADFGIHGVSAEIQSCFRLAKLYAQCLAPVSLRGATGTGKEVFARAIHYLGRRAAGAFVPVNCGALPEALFESELFGVVKGAYTSMKSTACRASPRPPFCDFCRSRNTVRWVAASRAAPMSASSPQQTPISKPRWRRASSATICCSASMSASSSFRA